MSFHQVCFWYRASQTSACSRLAWRACRWARPCAVMWCWGCTSEASTWNNAALGMEAGKGSWMQNSDFSSDPTSWRVAWASYLPSVDLLTHPENKDLSSSYFLELWGLDEISHVKYLQSIVLNQDLLLLVTHGATMSWDGGKCSGLKSDSKVKRFEILPRPLL